LGARALPDVFDLWWPSLLGRRSSREAASFVLVICFSQGVRSWGNVRFDQANASARRGNENPLIKPDADAAHWAWLSAPPSPD
jgi:hypothetical protein